MIGVIAVLALHVVTTAVGFFIDSPEGSALSDAHRAGVYIDVWLMPVVFCFVLVLVGRWLGGSATMTNVVWVVVWSQLPVIVLSVISWPMELAGMKISEPLFSNRISTENGQLIIEPAVLQLNADGVLFFVISTVLLLWSFQILLSGIASVERVSMKRALWFLTLAAIAMMLIRLPVTIALGDRDLLDVLGLKGILELPG